MTPRVRWALLGVVLLVAVLLAVFGRRVDVPPLPEGGSHLLVEPAQVDLGEVKPVTWHEITLSLRNPTERPIRVLKLAARCGCIETVSELPQVAAGSRVAFSLKYRSRDDAARDDSTIEFWTDESPDSKALMKIASQAKPTIVAEPSLLNFGDIKPGECKEQAVTIRHMKGRAFKVLKAICEPATEITAEAQPVEGGDGSQWRIAVTCRGGARGQSLQQHCVVQTDCADAPRVSFLVAANLTGNIVIEPKTLKGVAAADGKVGPWEVTLRRVTPGRIKVKAVKETGMRSVAYSVTGEGEEVKLSLSFGLTEPTTKQLRGLFVILIENELAALNVPYSVLPRQPAYPASAPPAKP